MAKVNYRSQFSYSFAGQPVVLRAKVLFDSSGDASIVSGTGMGIESIAHNSDGDYTISLSNSFAALLDVRAIMDAGSSAPAAPIMSLSDDSVDTSELSIALRDLSGVLTDPADGEVMYLCIELNRSSLSY